MTSKKLQNHKYTKTNGPTGKSPGERSGLQLGDYTKPEKLNKQPNSPGNGGPGSNPNAGKGRHTTL